MKLFLDTETTGLNDAEIVELALIDEHENILINTLIRPYFNPVIPHDATRIHGITNDMVVNAPYFSDILPALKSHVDGNELYIFNADYDTRLIRQSKKHTEMGIKPSHVHCVMKAFAPVYGEWNDYRQNYKWQSLDTACAYYRITNPAPHRALGDAISARRVWVELVKAGVMK
jgi:DNA polymerase III subunit epsilon